MYNIYPGQAGWTNTGWYFRSIHQSPQYFEIGPRIQIPRKSFVVIAIRYPSNSEFNVTMSTGSSSFTYTQAVSQADSYSHLAESGEDLYDDFSLWNCSLAENWADICHNGHNGTGPLWYFDGEFFYLRIVNLKYYTKFSYDDIKDQWYWNVNDMILWNIASFATFKINVTCDACDGSIDGFFDTSDYLPKQFPLHSWTGTGYYDNDTSVESTLPTLSTLSTLIVTDNGFDSVSDDDDGGLVPPAIIGMSAEKRRWCTELYGFMITLSTVILIVLLY